MKVTSGEHRIVVGDRERFRPWDQTIVVGVKEHKQVVAEPRSRVGKLILASQPRGAEVYVDGERKGVTPVVLKLLRGQHTITLRKEGYSEVSEKIEIDEQEVKRLSLELPRYRPALVRVKVSEPADIYVDGREVGSGSELTLQVPSREKVVITARKRGYLTAREAVCMHPREERTVYLFLRERPFLLGILSVAFLYNHPPLAGFEGGAGVCFITRCTWMNTTLTNTR